MEKKMNGTLVSEVLYEELREYMKKAKGRVPHLVDVSLGDDLGGKMYANMKKKKLEKMAGFEVDSIHLEDVTAEELLEKVDMWNKDSKLDGLMFQLPLPKEFAEKQTEILNNILTTKDVDGLTEGSIGKLFSGAKAMEPCTPKGIIALLKAYGVQLRGKRVCIVNRSNIVGKPLVQMFLNEDATVTICHSKTENLASVCREADILVAALNKQEMIDSSYVKEGAIVIDVGVHKNSEGKTVGDVKYDDIYPKASLITPPTGGVGPMTICMLAYNTAFSRYGEEIWKVLEKGLAKAKKKIENS